MLITPALYSPSELDSDLAALDDYDDSVHGVYEGRYLGSVPTASREGDATISASASRPAVLFSAS